MAFFEISEWLGLIEFGVEEVVIAKFMKLSNQSAESEWLDAMKDLDEVSKYYCSFGYLCHGNNTTTFPNSKWTILHHMAYHNAPLNVVKKFHEYNVCVGLKDNEGKTALEYVTNESEEYKSLFVPQYKYDNINFSKLKKLESQFHKFMMERLSEFNYKEEKLVLPQLDTYLEKPCTKEIHLEIPGMLGGFNTKFIFSEDGLEIIGIESYSLSRVCGGSDKVHKITENGWEFIKGGDYR